MNNTIAKNLGRFVRRNGPKFLTALGVTGIFSTAILAVNATPKACKLIAERQEELGVEKLGVVETVKTTWKLYLASLSSAILASACMVGSTSISAKRLAAMSAMVDLTQASYNRYVAKVKEVAGEEIHRKVRNETNADCMAQNPIVESDIYDTGFGKDLFYDPLCARYFWSSPAAIKDAECTLVKRQVSDMFITWNDYYDELNLPRIDSRVGDNFGWHIQEGVIEILFDSRLTPNNKACVVIDVNMTPKDDYQIR